MKSAFHPAKIGDLVYSLPAVHRRGRVDTYFITTPAGEELIINDMPKFCSTNNLHASLMYKVASGNRKTHKKFRCCLLYHEHGKL